MIRVGAFGAIGAGAVGLLFRPRMALLAPLLLLLFIAKPDVFVPPKLDGGAEDEAPDVLLSVGV